MLVLRPVRTSDLDALHALSLSTGGGLTTLPPDKAILARKIEQSIRSFGERVERAGEEYYLFVLEDLRHARVVGTSGIYATVGGSKPFYSYRILHLSQLSHHPEMRIDTRLLHLVNDYAGATELATLFLHPDYRISGNGALLSKARYLMIAAFPERFADKVMAEIRGWVNEDGRSPFWEAIGRHFFGMDFHEADRINGMGNSQFIADLMPKFPIYTSLLPDEAQSVIGIPHDNARGAVRLLTSEGFRFAGAVDIFDAGPCYEAPRPDIRTVRKTRAVTVAAIGAVDPGKGGPQMVSTSMIDDFRVVSTRLAKLGEDRVAIDREAADALGIEEGARLMTAPLRHDQEETR